MNIMCGWSTGTANRCNGSCPSKGGVANFDTAGELLLHAFSAPTALQDCHPFAALRACPRAQRRDDNPEAASFDSQNVFFGRYYPLWLVRSPGLQFMPGGAARPFSTIQAAIWVRELKPNLA